MFLYEHDNFRVSSMQKNTSAPSFPRGLKEEPHRHRLGWLQDGASPPVISWFINAHELVRYINHTAIEFSHFDISTGGPIL